MMSRKFISVLLIVLLPYDSHSQGNDGSPAGTMISHGHPKGGWMITYSLMRAELNGHLDGTKSISDDVIFNSYLMSPQTMRMDMHMLMGMYGCGARLSLMAMFSYTRMTMTMTMPQGSTHVHNMPGMTGVVSSDMTMKSAGIGDSKIWALYKLGTGEGSSLVASAGISIPSGSTDLQGNSENMFENQHLPYMMQLGTGSFDFLPGITYLKKSGRSSWSAQLLGTLRPFDNANSYRWGNELIVNAWFSRQFAQWISTSLRVEGVFSSSISGFDPMVLKVMEPDADADNYGGQRCLIFGGINLYVNSGVFSDTKAAIEIGLPLYQNLNGPQLATEFQILIGLTKSF